jgi:hypothetical protein
MSKIEIRQFKPEDFDALRLALRPDQLEVILEPNFQDRLPVIAKHPSYTALTGGQVIACAGVIVIWSGVGEAWVFTSKDLVREKRFSFHKGVLSYLRLIEERYKLHRIQATVWEEYAEGLAWIERLGFKAEGYLKAYGPRRENYYLYGRVNHVGR